MFSSFLEIADDPMMDCVDIIVASFSFPKFYCVILYSPMNVGMKSNDPYSSSDNFVTNERHSSLSSICKVSTFVVGGNVLRGFFIPISFCKQF